jgi:WD40 repeat protein
MDGVAVEGRERRGRPKGGIPRNACQAHTSGQCGSVVPQRLVHDAKTTFVSHRLLNRCVTTGELLASAGDDGNVILWVPSESQAPAFGSENLDDKETWRVRHMHRTSGAEIYDLAWSPDGSHFIIGSMDNVARIYSTAGGMLVGDGAARGASLLTLISRSPRSPDRRT